MCWALWLGIFSVADFALKSVASKAQLVATAINNKAIIDADSRGRCVIQLAPCLTPRCSGWMMRFIRGLTIPVVGGMVNTGVIDAWVLVPIGEMRLGVGDSSAYFPFFVGERDGC